MIERRTPIIRRPEPLNQVSYAAIRPTLTEPLYVGLAADGSTLIERIIMQATKSPYYHAFLIGHGGSDVFLLTESTAPRAQVCVLSDRIRDLSGSIDIFRIKVAMDLAGAWDWSLRCAGNPYSLADDGLVWLDRYMGLAIRPIPNSNAPKGCHRDCSCQVHAALRTHGLQPMLWPAEWPYDCMVAPCDLCEQANPDVLEYVCTPTWP